MKKLLLLAVAALFCMNSFATHLMGGQMTSRNIGGFSYEVTLTAYRDTLGIPINTTAVINYSEVGGGWTDMHTVPVAGPVIFGNGVEEYSYVDTITFPDSGNYNMWWEDCCRNGAILNMTTPLSESFHLNNALWVDPSNSSPVFLNPPITIAQLNVPFNYNPLPFDADGDSIVWSVDTPLTTAAAYVQGWTVIPADAMSPFTMNPLTGEVSFLPNTIGYFAVSFLVSEFRNGVKIGEIRRDMQIIVIPSPNIPPVITSNSNNYPYTGKSFTITPGSNFNLTVSVYDADGQGLSVTPNGEPMLLASNAATYSQTTGTNSITSTVNWTPDISQARVLPYILALRVSENYGSNMFSSDITYSLRVGNATGINTADADVVHGIYPNPSNGNFTVEMNSDKTQSVTLSITSMIGQQLKAIPQELNSGINILNVKNLDLPHGTYLMSVIANGKIIDTKTFEIRD
jgi:hypothetical protein